MRASGLCFFTVMTCTGLRVCAWAASPSDACSRVHGSVAAWEGFEPLTGAANDNRGRPFEPEDVTAFAEDDGEDGAA